MSKTKYTAILAAAAITAVTLSGCSVSADSTPDKSRLKVVCTVFPAYDWVKQITGSRADEMDITYLLGSGTDLHNFQPTADDIIRISDCDLLVYAGGESDEWVTDALEGSSKKDTVVVSMLDIIGDRAREEEVKEGMQGEEEEGEEGKEEPEYDEHVWLSLKNAKVICGGITDALCSLDPEGADTYRAGLNSYSAELDGLDSEFRELADGAEIKTVVFGDRFPFRYFVDDYGLDYYAAFVGCSAETEASFETVIFLAQKLDELGCKTIYTIENSDQSIARTIIDNTEAKDQSIAVLDSLQSVSSADIEGGETYISAMRKNYDVLKNTLK